MMSTAVDLDLCVIGASEAGLAACMGAVALGLSCALVDDGDADGLRNPDLVLAALSRQAVAPDRHADAWVAVAEALAQAAPDRRHARFGAMNIRLVRGSGRFIDSATLEAGGQILRARRFFIATGGTQPAWRMADGLATGIRLSVADLGAVRDTPKAALVVGGSPEALSAAQSLSRFGSRVTLVADSLLLECDAELAAPLITQLQRDGVALAPARLVLVEPGSEGLQATLSDGRRVTADRLILAERASPALERLDVSRARIAVDGDGLILDGNLRTRNRAVFAIGRAAGAGSTAEGIVQAAHALRAAFVPVPGRLRPELVPMVTATDPQIAIVGRCPSPGMGHLWRHPLAQTAGAAALGITEGHAKIVTDARGRLVWAGLVGPSVRELIPFWALAIGRGLTLADLAEVVPPVPSLSESVRAIAVQDFGRRLASPWARRILRAARWLG